MYISSVAILALAAWIIYLLWRVRQLSKIIEAETRCLARAINIILSDFCEKIHLENKNKKLTRRDLAVRIAMFTVFLDDYAAGSLMTSDKISETQILGTAFPGRITYREGLLSEKHRNQMRHELRAVVTHELGIFDHKIEEEADKIIDEQHRTEVELYNRQY